MTTVLAPHHTTLAALAEQAAEIQRALAADTPAGLNVDPQVAAPLGLAVQFLTETAQRLAAGQLYSDLVWPPTEPAPVTFTFTADELAQHNTKVWAEGFNHGAQLPTVRPTT